MPRIYEIHEEKTMECPLSIPLYHIELVREGSLKRTRPTLRSSAEVAVLFRAYLGHADREHMMVVMLDNKLKVIGMNTVSVGSLTASIVHPREVFKPAILCNAQSIVLCHNHPSGDPAPSQEDKGITKRLVLAGEALGIKVNDHIILGDGTKDYYSFTDQREL